MKMRSLGIALLVTLGVGIHAKGSDVKTNGTTLDRNAKSPVVSQEKVQPTFLRDVAPIFMGKCVRCHRSETKIMHNWLDYKSAFDDRAEIKRRIWDSWKKSYFKEPMPVENSPEALAMTEGERQTIKAWVESGAVYGVPATLGSPQSKSDRIEAGRKIFMTVCAACHQSSGQGIPGRFPPLAASDFLNADKSRAINILIAGIQGEIYVNGRKYDNSMPLFPMGDEDIANTLTFVCNSFGNSGMEVTPAEVKAVRGKHDDENHANGQKKRASLSASSPWE